jgi:hypothetical protein
VHAVPADRGISERSSLWTAPGRAWLTGLELPPTPRAIIQDGWGLLDALATPIARLECQIAALARPDPRVQALMALPGVGRLTAMTLVAEIGDIGRFPTARKLCAWAGLTPQVRNSDRTVRHGHITNQGSPWMRWSLQEAAQTAKRHPMFADTYSQLARRRGANIATVAIARRLLARSFHILTQLEAQKASEKASPGALASLHEPATRPPVLTEQPGSGLHRHADPTSPGARMGACEPTRDVVPALSPTDFAPQPTPQANQPKPPAGRAGPFTPLDKARPHGCADVADGWPPQLMSVAVCRWKGIKAPHNRWSRQLPHSHAGPVPRWPVRRRPDPPEGPGGWLRYRLDGTIGK